MNSKDARSMAWISLRAVLASTAGVAAVCCATGAVAQEASASPQASQQESDAIVVTARKREETLQDTSAAVSVVGAERLREGVITDVRDIQTIIPTVTVGEVVGLMKVNIRGLGNSTNTRSEDSDVVLHIDGAVVSRMEAQSAAFFDLERVEVLRGPQGTLYGRNSTGGTINLITRKPTDTFEGDLNATLGNYDFVKLDAAAGGPVADWLSVRGAVQSIQRSGFGVNIGTGNDIDDEKRFASRVHLLFQPAPDVDFLLTGEYAHQDDASGFFTFLGPNVAGTTPRGAGGFSDPNSRDGAASTDPQLEKDTYSITGTLDWRLGGNWSLRNILNYRQLDFRLVQDLDTSTVAGATVVDINLFDLQFSEELQLIYSGDRLNAIAGLFYFDEVFKGTNDIGTGPQQGVFFTLYGRSSTEAMAAFWNAAYDVNDTFTVRLGGRYNDEDRAIANDSILNGVLNNTPLADDERSLSKYTGEYGLDVNFDANNLLYYTFAEGFRSGAALIQQSNSPIIDPTQVESHEIGYKFQSPDGRLSASLAVFSANIQDLQATKASLNPNGTLNTRVDNVNELETNGAELDFLWAPTDQFRASGAVAYLQAEYKDFLTDDPFVAGNNPIQVAGNTPRLSPEWKGNLHLEYDFLLADDARLTVGGDISYVGDQFFDEFNRAPFVEDAYTLVDASLRYQPGQENWSLSLWGKNLTDEKVFADLTFSAFGGVQSKHFINPLTWGVSANFRF